MIASSELPSPPVSHTDLAPFRTEIPAPEGAVLSTHRDPLEFVVGVAPRTLPDQPKIFTTESLGPQGSRVALALLETIRLGLGGVGSVVIDSESVQVSSWCDPNKVDSVAKALAGVVAEAVENQD